MVTAALVLATSSSAAQEVTGGVRAGVYEDDDRTEVVRMLATIQAALTRWRLSARESVDTVSSASIDVRTSPYIDAMTSASALGMSDRRFETTLGAGYDDGNGHTAGLSLVHALERDYQSISVGLNTSFDLFSRNTTLLASVHASHNWIGSIFDPSFARTMDELGYSIGVAQVLSPSAAVRLRYDASIADGYQASPYRAVRFGDWTTMPTRDSGVLTFVNTIGPATGLPENVPEDRVRHAVVGEWVQSLARPVALATEIRLALDSWGVRSLTAGAELRFQPSDPWQLSVGYRFFIEGAADFFLPKYTQEPTMYEYYTSDKELGEERGHLGSFDLGYIVKNWPSAGRSLQFDAQLNFFRYRYPGFVLLEARGSVFADVGLRLDF